LEIEPTLRKASGGGVLCGFRNKLREENGRWWHTRKWLVQSGFWLLLINGLSVTAYFQLSKSTATFSWGELVGIFTGLLGWMAVFGVIILTQSEVVEERQTGTAEWVLSAPLSRASFIFSKVVVNLAWLLAILVLLQGIVFSLVMDLLNVGTILWSDLLVGLALQGLGLAFWLCMSIMLGTFFKSRSAVIGVPLVFVFLQQFIPSLFGSLSSSVALVLPERLPEYSTNAFMGVSIPSAIPIITAAVLSVAFVLLAIVRFSREEFTGS
jgi:ABC-type transport system involved in multi-copper enzyme maturation permease subunit